MPAFVAVVLAVLNGARTLADQLAALADQDEAGQWELVVVDNGSTDGSGDLARTWTDRFPALRIVEAFERQNLSYARNVGAREAKGDFLMFCDADDVVSRRWIAEMRALGDEFDLIGGRLDLERLNSDQIRTWAPHPTPGGLPFGLDFLPYAVGANFGIKAAVFAEVGGCDEFFASCGDDIDLSWRVQLAGYRLGYAPNAVVHYRLRDDLRALIRQQRAYGRADVALRAKFSEHGVPPAADRRHKLTAFRGLVYADHLVRSRGLRWQWFCDMAFHLGIAEARREFRRAKK